MSAWHQRSQTRNKGKCGTVEAAFPSVICGGLVLIDSEMGTRRTKGKVEDTKFKTTSRGCIAKVRLKYQGKRLAVRIHSQYHDTQ